ncbi:sensor histidine kinase [Niabella insulamsoli]|uniref:sensor histidine kinase n=1 Tax=Niabella insulamsoli TaxID=3144874 RepID=UPI0031FD12CF
MPVKLVQLVLALIVFFPIEIEAQVVDLSAHNPANNLGRKITYFKDSTAALNLQQARELFKKGKFAEGKTDILNFGNSPAAMWVRLEIKSSIDITDYLIVDVANIERIDCYTGDGSGWRKLSAGSLTKADPGVRSNHQYIFPLDNLERGTVNEIWLRAQSRNIMLMPLKVARADNLYLVENATSKIIELCFIGFLCALILFHLFIYVSLKDRAYLYYCLYILSLGMYTIGYLGGYSYLLGEPFRIFTYTYPHLFFAIGFAMSILITNRFYNLKNLSLPLYRWTNLLFASLVVLFLISILGYKALAAWGAQTFGLLVPLTLAITSLFAYSAERKAVISLSAAWLVFIVAVIFYVLSLQGTIEYKSYSRLVLHSGVLLEFMLLAIALGQRYRFILERQRKAEAANFKLIQTHNAELEQKVAQRTATLNDVIIKLKNSDEIKSKLFSIVAHDLRTPFDSMLAILSSDNIDLFDAEELKFMLRANSNHIQQLKIMLDNMLFWARSQMQDVKVVAENFDMLETVDLLTAIYQPIAREKKIEIKIQHDSRRMRVRADKNHIQLVLRNLFDNAVKFTPPAGAIDIHLYNAEGKVHFTIENNCLPAAPQKNNEAEKKGLGLGLSLCEDYLNRNKSSLIRKSSGQSISFAFELPAADTEI